VANQIWLRFGTNAKQMLPKNVGAAVVGVSHLQKLSFQRHIAVLREGR